MSTQKESLVLEQLKELVKANGNQAAAILDAVIEVLSKGGTPTFEGDNGNVMQSDGDGGIVANTEVNISAGGNFNAAGSISAGGNFDAAGSISAGGKIDAAGSISAGGVNSDGKVVTIDDVVVGGNVVIGDQTHSNSIHLFSSNGTEYEVTVSNGGELVTQVV